MSNGYFASTAEAISSALGFQPERSSRALKWANVEMLAWRGEVDDCAFRTHEELVIVFHTGGALRVPVECATQSGRRLSRPGSLTIIPPATSSIWHVDGGVHSYSVHLAKSCLGGLLGPALDRAHSRLQFHCGVPDALLWQLVGALAGELWSPTEIGPLYAESLADSIGLHIARSASAATFDAPYDRLKRMALQRVLDTIESHLEAGLSLQQLADEMGISRAHFATSFRQSIGISPHRYLTQRRIARAKSLLMETLQPLCDVALNCGFASQSHFTAQFRRATGHTPARFRGLSA